MAKRSSARSVRCYLCGHVFEIPPGAMTTSCPGCFKRVVIEDIVVKTAQGNTVLGTCGRLIVQARASVVARKITAIQGVEVLGTLESAVESDGTVRLGATAKWKGDCTARAMVVEPGATISGGFFSIGAEPTIEKAAPEATRTQRGAPE